MDNSPIETEPDVFLAIWFATRLHKIIIVESAGGSANARCIDDEVAKINSFWDSRAIIVGGGISPTICDENLPTLGSAFLKRASLSNYGKRIDCQGWAENVRTTAPYGPLDDVHYTGYSSYPLEPKPAFSGTSSAAVMVAGAVALVQSVNKAAGKKPITPAAMRQALRSTGQPQPSTDSSVFPIGSLPDIRQLLRYFEVLPDCFLRDDLVTDTGDPKLAPGPLTFDSQDILPLREPVAGSPDSVLGGNTHWDEAFGEILVRGERAEIYLRVTNRGHYSETIKIRLFWAAIENEDQPDEWTEIGLVEEEIQGTEVGGNANRVVTSSIAWDPVAEEKELCLIAVVESDYYKQPGFDYSALDENELEYLHLFNKVAFRRIKTRKPPCGCCRILFPWWG